MVHTGIVRIGRNQTLDRAAADPDRSGELAVPLRVVSHLPGRRPQIERPPASPVEACPPEVAGRQGCRRPARGLRATRSDDPPNNPARNRSVTCHSPNGPRSVGTVSSGISPGRGITKPSLARDELAGGMLEEAPQVREPDLREDVILGDRQREPRRVGAGATLDCQRSAELHGVEPPRSGHTTETSRDEVDLAERLERMVGAEALHAGLPHHVEQGRRSVPRSGPPADTRRWSARHAPSK